MIYNNLVYLCRENGTVTCLDAKTGEQLYSESPHRQTYRASPVAGDGKIYITSRDGMVTVLQAGREFKVWDGPMGFKLLISELMVTRTAGGGSRP